ncbi:hypothetical protein TNCV_5013201 [Trichonephila clavipes]|nr:hypothetical protein TNCV_5013201 [Trichonephila clavipes]
MKFGENTQWRQKDPMSQVRADYRINMGIDILVSTRGLLATDQIILSHGQVTWTTPEPEVTWTTPEPEVTWTTPELLTTTPHHGRMFQLSIDLTCIAALHGGSLVVLGSNSRHACHAPIP